MPAAHFALFLSVVAHVLLIFFLGFRMAAARYSAAKKGEVDLERMAIDHTVWPTPVRKISNAYMNQFEMPVLFYAAVLFAFTIGGAGWLMAILGCVYVLIRYVHAFVHIGRNVVILRFQVFILSAIVLLVMWGYLTGHALGGYLAVA